MTSLRFMLVWVPLPVCQIDRGNWSSCSPARISSQACSTRCRRASSNRPSSLLTWAAAFFTSAKAWMNSGGKRSLPMPKWCRERWVCAPHKASAATATSPMESLSSRVAPVCSGGSMSGLLPQQLLQYVWQNASAPEEGDVIGGIQTTDQIAALALARAGDHVHAHGHAGLELVKSVNMNGLGAVELQRLAIGARRELQRQHSHAGQVGAVNTFETLRDHRLHTQQAGAFGCPVAARAGAVLQPGDDDQRSALRQILHRCVVDAHLLRARQLAGVASLNVLQHLIADADVGKRASHHHFVIAAT